MMIDNDFLNNTQGINFLRGYLKIMVLAVSTECGLRIQIGCKYINRRLSQVGVEWYIHKREILRKKGSKCVKPFQN